jgi:hypothetical protein
MCRQFTVTVSSCGHYRHRRFSCRRVGASTGVIEEPSAVLVRSRVRRRRARRAEVPLCARGSATPRRSSHAVARRARVSLPVSPRPSRLARVVPAREFAPFVAARAAFGHAGARRVRNRRPAAARRSLRELRFTEYVPLWARAVPDRNPAAAEYRRFPIQGKLPRTDF